MADNKSKATQDAAKQQNAAEDNATANATAGTGNAKVNPKLNASSVILAGEDFGGEGKNGNEFYEGKKYSDVPDSAFEQKGNEGLQLLVKA